MSFFRQLVKPPKNPEVENKLLELNQINQKLLSILQTISRGVFVIETDGKIFFWGDAVSKLTGINSDEALGRDFQKVLPLSFIGKNPPKLILELLETKKTFGYEYLLNINFKKNFPILLTLTPLITEEKKFIGAVGEIEDISEKKRLDQLKLDFVSLVSHELRTPIANIKGYLSLVLDEAESLSDEHRKFIRRAYLSNERQLRTVEDLLSASKIEQGVFQIQTYPLQVEDLIASVVSEWQPQAQEKNLELKFIYPKFPLPRVVGNEERIQEILVNLISNAIKYTKKGSIVVEVNASDKEASISIKDTGIGISPEEQKNLFEKFQRGQRPLTSEAQGTGLGLYIAKTLTELMDGKIWVESKTNEGSTFTFTLPIAEVKKVATS